MAASCGPERSVVVMVGSKGKRLEMSKPLN
jgi:hypothetical protein